MRRIYTAVALALMTMATIPASAQVKLGVKGGLNVSKMSVSSDVLDADNRAGWFFGPTLKLTVPIVGLSFDVSALYDQKSTKVSDDNNGSKTIKQQAIDIPVNVRYGVGLGDAANIFFFAGPQFAFNVGDKEFKWNSTSSYENTFQLKKSTLSVNVGAGVTLLSHLQLTANYNIACGKTGDATVWNTVEKTSQEVVKNGRTNSWQVGVAYFF
jgi:opacity protein-like surface antigen